MGAKKRKKTATDPPPPPLPQKKKKITISNTGCIKMSLRRACKDPELTKKIGEWSIEMTKCSKLATLNIHCELNQILQSGDNSAIDKFFGQFVDKNFFVDYFRGTQMIGVNPQYSGYTLNEKVRQLCLKYLIEAPVIGSFGNVVEYAAQKQWTNMQTNICYHAKSRIKKFIVIHQHLFNLDKTAINDTLHYLFYSTSEKLPDPRIITAIEEKLRPVNFGSGKGYFYGIQSKWFQYVPLFWRLQR